MGAKGNGEDAGNLVPDASPEVKRAEKLINKKLWVQLKDGRNLCGYLTCLDKQGNIILSNATEAEPPKKIENSQVMTKGQSRLVGTVLIPKNYRTSCYAEVPLEDIVNEQLSV
jgi:small nuclear ribonucleoprotein (snRNP)-like protein